MVNIFRLAFLSWILLNSSFYCGKEPTIEFKIFDGLGKPSTFLYENGLIHVTCIAPTTKAEVALKADLVDDTTVELSRSNATLSFNVSLDLYNYKKMFCYSGTDRSAKLVIAYRMCNPLLMTPPKVGCSEEEVCVRNDAASAVCQKTSSLNCEMDDKTTYDKNLPDMKYVCLENENAVEKDYETGLCTARKVKTHGFSGISTLHTSCVNYKFLHLDGQKTLEGSIFFKSMSDKVLNIEFKSITAAFEKAECEIKSLTVSNLLPIRANDTNVQNNAVAMKYDISVNENLENMPLKGMLICFVKKMKNDVKTTSVHVVLYDERQFRMKVSKLPVKNKPGTFTLTCTVEPIDGIYFTVAWDEEPAQYMNITTANKTISDRFEDIKKKFICFASGYAYQHPVKGELLKLPKSSIQKSIEIERGTEQTGDGNGPGGRSGNSTKDSLQNKENNSSKTNSVDLAKVVGIVVGLLLLFVIIAVVAFFAVNFVRKRSKQAFLRICRKDKEHTNSAVELLELRSNLRKTVAKIAHDRSSATSVLPKEAAYKAYMEEYNELAAITIANENVGYLSTARCATEPIVRSTWTNKSDPGCFLEPTKPEKMDSTKPVKGLHMNTITDCYYKDRFIASSLPMEHELPLFFQTIYEKNIPIIMYLGDCDAKDPTLHKYWAQTTKKTFGAYSVTGAFQSRDERMNEFHIISITKNATEDERVIQHIWWRHFTTLSMTTNYTTNIFDISHVVSLLRDNERKKGKEVDQLALVQCEDGIKLTGAFLAVAMGIQFVDKFGLPTNCFQIVKKLREERANALNDSLLYLHAVWSIANYFNCSGPELDRSARLSGVTVPVVTSYQPKTILKSPKKSGPGVQFKSTHEHFNITKRGLMRPTPPRGQKSVKNTKTDSSPNSKPVTSQISKPVTSPNSKPVTSPNSKPVTSPNSKPVTSPNSKPVTSQNSKLVTSKKE